MPTESTPDGRPSRELPSPPASPSAATLVAVWAAVAMLPAALAWLPPLPAPTAAGFRGAGVEIGVMLGAIAAGVMATQFALTARFGGLSRRFGQDTLLRLHRAAGYAAAALLVGHQAVLILAEPAYAAFFDPRVNLPRAAALSAANAALAAIILLTIFRARWGVSYEWWRATHGALAALLIIITIAHTMKVGTYYSSIPKRAAFVAMMLIPLGLLLHVRLGRPWLTLRRRPWRVAAVRPEAPGVWTVDLEPVGHAGLRFDPGQFAWVTFGPSPLSMRQHPFTIASSAERPARLSFTIKALGDFTSTVGGLAPGTTAFIEGPAGNFVPPLVHPPATGKETPPPLLLIAGGIGITPMMSILRTMRDRGERRPVLLLYAARTVEEAVFRGELAALANELPLRTVLIPESPAPQWNGPSGLITKGLLEEILAENAALAADSAGGRGAVMVCGPEAMMDAVESALRRMGVPRRSILSERFVIV